MIYIICLIIPTLVMLASFYLYGHKISKEEIVVQVIAPTLLSFLSILLMSISMTWDSEYLGHYITSCEHHEAWNEYVHRTCTRTVGTGKDAREESYDCSYVQYHPEYFEAFMNTGISTYINENRYNELVKLFNNQEKIGHNSGHSISGDIFETKFDGNFEHLQPYTTIHHYKNKVQASHSVFKFQDIPDEEAEELGLYKYSKSSSYGVNIPRLEKLNGYYGSQYQIRTLVLVYNVPMSIFEKQRSYWSGGNKNELVIGIGLDKGKVSWVNVFTWSEADDFVVKLRKELEKQIGTSPDYDRIVEYLKKEIPLGWKRKEFGDFEYLEVENAPYFYAIAMVVSFVSSVIITFLAIRYELS